MNMNTNVYLAKRMNEWKRKHLLTLFLNHTKAIYEWKRKHLSF